MSDQLTVRKIGWNNLMGLFQIERILYRCGKDMHQRYELQHWNNSHLKNIVILALCFLKNDIFAVYEHHDMVATFQTSRSENRVHFQKLATDPRYAGRGIGSFCLNKIERMALENGCSAVQLEVYDKSSHAIEFYEHHDYRHIDTMKTRKYTEIVMEKVLTK